MELIKELLNLDFGYLFLGLCLILLVVKTIWVTLEWLLVDKLGLETKKQREIRRSQKELEDTKKLAEQTAKNLSELESRHTNDEKEFRENLNKHMSESEKDRKILHQEMKTYSENRVKDREQSMLIQKELTSSMEKLTTMFLDKEIDDMRWEILNFCAALSDGRKYNRESFAHVFRTYEKYERILKENKMENGLVEESIDYIREAYREGLKKGIIK